MAQVEQAFLADVAVWSSIQPLRALPTLRGALPAAAPPFPKWSDFFRTPKMERLVSGEEMEKSPTSFKAGGPFFVGSVAAAGAGDPAVVLHTLFYVGFVPLIGLLGIG